MKSIFHSFCNICSKSIRITNRAISLPVHLIKNFSYEIYYIFFHLSMFYFIRDVKESSELFKFQPIELPTNFIKLCKYFFNTAFRPTQRRIQ